MAIGIFNKEDGSIFRAVLDDAAKININIIDSDYDIVTISNDLYSNLIKTKKWAKLENGSVVESVIGDNEKFTNSSMLKLEIDNKVIIFKGWLINNKNKNIYNDVKDYVDYLENLDLSTFTFPMTQTLEEYCESNGVTFFHPLQT